MKVKELKKLLEKFDDNARVVLEKEYDGEWANLNIVQGLLDDSIDYGLYTGEEYSNEEERDHVCQGIIDEFYDEDCRYTSKDFEDVVVLTEV